MRSAILGLVAAAFAVSCATPVTPNTAASPVSAPVAEPRPQQFLVRLTPGSEPQSGRLIVVAMPAAEWKQPTGPGADPLERPRYLSPGSSSYVAAQEAPSLSSAPAARFDADMLAHPKAFSAIEAGEYWVQVRLDTDHDFAYSSISDPNDDYTSVPVKLRLPSAAPIAVTLLPERDVWSPESIGRTIRSDTRPRCNGRVLPDRASADEAASQMRPIDFISPALSEFWGRPIHICGVVLLPPDYDTSAEKYPTVYRTEGFGGSIGITAARRHYQLMKSGETPPMIRVFLDHSSPWGTHEFADSVNNGPWGFALTEELIPELEKQYRMDAKPSGRLVTGHSSGGWFAIWQQVRYPEIYGGSWARAPDPVDFRSFTGIDIYRDDANAYVRPDGSEQYLVRDARGCETTSFREYARREDVLGDYGGQIDSFDWVFSPRGDDGRPQPLFDRMTGRIDPKVAQYWRDHYDVSYAIRRDWPSLKPVLDGKIHLIMGTKDTFHLNEAAVLLEQELQKLGAKAEFLWMEGRNHGNLDMIGEDPNGLEKKIAWEMWAVARPGSPLKPKPYAGAPLRSILTSPPPPCQK